MPAHHPHQVSAASVSEALGSLMRGELAAAETYRHAVALCGADAPADLAICLHSHDQRATSLAEHITLVGGTPVSGSAPWGAFARVVHAASGGLVTRSVLVALEEGEDEGLDAYRASLDHLDAAATSLVRGQLLPEQVRTHGLMSALCRRMA